MLGLISHSCFINIRNNTYQYIAVTWVKSDLALQAYRITYTVINLLAITFQVPSIY